MLSKLLATYRAWRKKRNFSKALGAVLLLDKKELEEIRDYISGLLDLLNMAEED